jgi:hypothetical protein
LVPYPFMIWLRQLQWQVIHLLVQQELMV